MSSQIFPIDNDDDFVTPIAQKQQRIGPLVGKRQELLEQKQQPLEPLVEQKEENFGGQISQHNDDEKISEETEDSEDSEMHEDDEYVTPSPKIPAPSPAGLLGPVTRRLLGPNSAFLGVTKKIKQMVKHGK